MIQAYLDRVKPRLAGPDRDETLSGIESHIYEAISERIESGETGAIAEAVLAELDPPENYGSDPAASTSERGLLGYVALGLLLTGLLVPFILAAMGAEDMARGFAVTAVILALMCGVFGWKNKAGKAAAILASAAILAVLAANFLQEDPSIPGSQVVSSKSKSNLGAATDAEFNILKT